MRDTGYVSERYFDWLCEQVSGWQYDGQHHSYRKLMRKLFHTDYDYDIPMDANRYDDGMELRYRFGREEQMHDGVIARDIDIDECSMLEMMVAMCLRCSEEITLTVEDGSTPYRLFREMIFSLGLIQYDDEHYREVEVDYILERFVNAEYEPDGDGGLFYIPGYDEDLRNVELWGQMYRYLDAMEAR